MVVEKYSDGQFGTLHVFYPTSFSYSAFLVLKYTSTYIPMGAPIVIEPSEFISEEITTLR